MPGMAPPSARPGVSHTSIREPLGVVGLATPWNFPLAIPTWRWLRPDLRQHHRYEAGEQRLPERGRTGADTRWAGLPDGVLNMVTGPGGAVGTLSLPTRASRASLHGLHERGPRHPGQGRGQEGPARDGRQEPYVVMEDADLSDAAAKVSFGAFGYAGEKCTASSQAIVVEGLRRVHRGAQERDRGHEGRRSARRGHGHRTRRQRRPVRQYSRSSGDGQERGARGTRWRSHRF